MTVLMAIVIMIMEGTSVLPVPPLVLLALTISCDSAIAIEGEGGREGGGGSLAQHARASESPRHDAMPASAQPSDITLIHPCMSR